MPIHSLYCVAIALGLATSFSPLAHSETVNISRRLIRFDGKPAAGAKVRVSGDYGYGNEKADFDVIAGADGIFSVDVTQENKLWVGHLVVRAEGCAITCEVGVTGSPKNAPSTLVLQLGAPFQIEGTTTDVNGRPIANAKVSLVSAQSPSSNEIPFNSTTTCLTSTPEFIAHSTNSGTWSMMGIDMVWDNHTLPSAANFEAVVENPLRASRISLKIDPDIGSQKDIPLAFTLASPFRLAGRIVNSVNGEPVSGVRCMRSEAFTSLADSSAVTDDAGRFELEIPGPQRGLWFWVCRDGFAMTTVQTAMRSQATNDWGNTNDLFIKIRPIVAVSGTLLDKVGKPPNEPVELSASYNDKINAIWNQECDRLGTESKVYKDGSFNGKLPAGPITVALISPPQQEGSIWVVGMPPKNCRLQQQVNIPASGMKGLQLEMSQ